MRTRLCCTACITVLAIILLSGCAESPAGRTTVDFNHGWRFAQGEQTGNPAEPGFDDGGWETVRLPHDWAAAGPFDPEGRGSTGKLPWRGLGWYRKEFTLDADDAGRQVYIDFDGVMAFPKVYVNGEPAGEWDYGYSSFRVDATPHVRFGETNTIAVSADTRDWYSRWYPGAGIYRKVTMTICEPVHIAHWGMQITTPAVSDDAADVRICTTVENHRGMDVDATVHVTVLDPDGAMVAEGESSGGISGDGLFEADVTLTVDSPRRWDIDTPELYTVRAVVMDGGAVIDEMEDTFGIRTFRFTADDGFYLNGRRVQMYGVNLHHGHGPLGAAFHTRAMERQLEIMQEMGVNALRTSHNTPAPEVLELCDRMGILVWDECFDKWERTAGRTADVPLEEFGERQIRNMVMRDRNHPSIVVWSIGNEIPNQPDSPEGKSAGRVAFMTDFVLKYDTTRPVGLGCCFPETSYGDTFDALDLTGWNYGSRYLPYRENYPDNPIIYSESASTLSTRGFYSFPLADEKTDYARGQRQVSSYDRNAALWSDIPDWEFYRMEKDNYVAGEYVWTGFDYLGEPTPYTREARSSYFGIVDLCGIPKDRFYLYRSYWRPDETTVHILPHWNWPDRVGETVPVYVYTNGDSAELFLNGRSLGRRSKDIAGTDNLDIRTDDYYAILERYRLMWNDVVYEPGELRVVAYRDGNEIGEAVMRTAGEPLRLSLTPDRTTIGADGYDLSYILVEAVDESGTVCPNAMDMVRYAVDGPAEIAGIGNGNPLGLEPLQDEEHSLFYGKAILIVRSLPDEAGTVTINASAPGYETAEAQITTR